MPISHRTYSVSTDFERIRELIRRAFKVDANAKAWSFAHFDIWSQRQLGCEYHTWQKVDIHLKSNEEQDQ